MAVVDARHEQAEPEAAGRLRERREHRPALQAGPGQIRGALR